MKSLGLQSSPLTVLPTIERLFLSPVQTHPAEQSGQLRKPAVTICSSVWQQGRRNGRTPVVSCDLCDRLCVIIHGTAGKTVPVAQGDALQQALAKAGAKDVKYMRIDGAGHGVFGQHSTKTHPAMMAFFDSVLKKENDLG